MNPQTTAILEKIMEVCPELTCDCQQGHVPLGMGDDGEVVWDACPFCVDHDRDPMYIPELKTAHLEHLLRALGINYAINDSKIWGVDRHNEMYKKEADYNLTLTVRQNLEASPELTDWLYRILVDNQ